MSTIALSEMKRTTKITPNGISKRGKSRKVAIATSKIFTLHRGSQSHPDRPRRILEVFKKLSKYWRILPTCSFIRAGSVTKSVAALVHPPKFFSTISNLPTVDSLFVGQTKNSFCEVADDSFDITKISDLAHTNTMLRPTTPVYESGDMFWNKYTSRSAIVSAGTVVSAVKSVLDGKFTSAFAIVRPPGHHAGPAKAEGFCWLNNVSIAAKFALKYSDRMKKILILDWDVHHGNGTQDIFYEDDKVLFISMHRLTFGFYPGSGRESETGRGSGKGYSVNIPWRARGFGDIEYRAAFEAVVKPIAKAFCPDMVIVSAGFDAAEGDVLGQMSVTPAGFGWMAAEALKLAGGTNCVFALEGGYCADATALSVMACLHAIGTTEVDVKFESIQLGEVKLIPNKSAFPPEVLNGCNRSALYSLRDVCSIQSEFWDCMKDSFVIVDKHIKWLEETSGRNARKIDEYSDIKNFDPDRKDVFGSEYFSGLGGLSGFMSDFHGN